MNAAYESVTSAPECKVLNTLWIRNRVDAKSGYFLSGDVIRSSPFFTLITIFKMATSTHALLPIFPDESWALEWILILVSAWCGRANSIWIRIRVDVENFESGKKSLRIKKYLDTCWRALGYWVHVQIWVKEWWIVNEQNLVEKYLYFDRPINLKLK